MSFRTKVSGLTVAFYMRRIQSTNQVYVKYDVLKQLNSAELNASAVEYLTVLLSLPFIAVLCGTTT